MKTNTLKTIALIILLAVTSFAFGQDKMNIKGRILDNSNSQPIAYANVLLYNTSNSEIIKGDFCNEQGEFEIDNIEEGEYYICVSHISYQYKMKKMKISEKNMNLGNIKVESKDIALSEIKVTGTSLFTCEEEVNLDEDQYLYE